MVKWFKIHVPFFLLFSQSSIHFARSQLINKISIYSSPLSAHRFQWNLKKSSFFLFSSKKKPAFFGKYLSIACFHLTRPHTHAKIITMCYRVAVVEIIFIRWSRYVAIWFRSLGAEIKRSENCAKNFCVAGKLKSLGIFPLHRNQIHTGVI